MKAVGVLTITDLRVCSGRRVILTFQSSYLKHCIFSLIVNFLAQKNGAELLSFTDLDFEPK